MLPTNRLHSARSVHAYRRFSSFCGDGCDGGGAGTGSGRLRFANSTFEKASFYIGFIFADHKLNVNPILEVMMASDFGCFGLPTRSELVHKTSIMRITH